MDSENNALGQGPGEKGPKLAIAVLGLMGLLLYVILQLYTTSTNMKAALIGYLLMVLNLLAVGAAWSWIIKKKFIALTAPLIVLKQALLGLVLYLVVTEQNLDLTWFVIGFVWFFLAIILAGIFNSKSKG